MRRRQRGFAAPASEWRDELRLSFRDAHRFSGFTRCLGAAFDQQQCGWIAGRSEPPPGTSMQFSGGEGTAAAAASRRLGILENETLPHQVSRGNRAWCCAR